MLNMSMLTFNIQPAKVGAIPPEIVLGYWKFDEGYGTIAYDESFYNNDGEVHNASWVSGVIGQALHFNGTDDSYVEVPDKPELTPSTHLTIDVWIKPESYPTFYMAIIYKGDSNQTGCFGERSYSLWARADGAIHFSWTPDGEDCQWHRATSPGLIPTGEWSHVEVDLDTGVGELYIFIDGQKVLEENSPIGTIKVGDQPLRIGGMFRSLYDQSNFKGAIDEVRILGSRARSIWPMFQHDPQRTGRSTFLGPEENPEVYPLIQGESEDDYFNTPVIDSYGDLYLTARITKGGATREGLLALNPDGSQKWLYEVANPGGMSNRGCMPALWEPECTVYILSYGTEFGGVSAVDIRTGGLKWRRSYEVLYDAQHPVVGEDGKLYFIAGCILPDESHDSCLLAFYGNGEVAWAYAIQSNEIYHDFQLPSEEPAGLWSPGPASAVSIDREGTIYFGYNRTLFAIDSNGSEKWRRVLTGEIWGAPSIADDGTIYVVGDEGYSDVLHAIDPENPQQDRWTWASTTIQGPPTISCEGNIYFSARIAPMNPSSYLYGLDSEGNILENWGFMIGGYTPAGHLVLDSEENVYCVIDYGAKAYSKLGEEKWLLVVGGMWQHTTSLGKDGALYVPGQTCLYAITGVPPTPPPPPPPSDTEPPALIENFVTISGEDKQVTLRWTNPPDIDLAEVVVLRKMAEYPDNHFDGELVYGSTSPSPGIEIEFIDTPLVNGRIYFYAVFSRDSTGNWNNTVSEGKNAATATPSNPANQPPEARFVYSPTDPKLIKTWKSILFDASSSSDDDEITLFEWDWDGNGKYDWLSDESKVTFVYDQSGTYQVNLRVTDSDGARDTTSRQITISTWGFWDRFRKDYVPPDPEAQITNEDYQYIKDQLYIFTLSNDLNEYWEFRDYYDSEDRDIGCILHGYCDSDLRQALNMEEDPEHSPGLTYGVHILDALKEMDKVEQIWTQGYKMKASAYFSDLLDANSKWTSVFDSESLLEATKDILIGIIEELQPNSGVLGAGVGVLGFVNDCVRAGIPVYKLAQLLYCNTLYRYLELRHSGESHASAWQEIIQVPTEDYHLPRQITDDPSKLAATESLFRRLFESYGDHFSDWYEFEREVKKDLRLFLSEVLKRVSLVGHVVVVPHSPVEIRVYDAQGNLTGIVNGELFEYIPDSACDNETGMVGILSAGEGIYFEVVGIGLGSYGLEIALVETGVNTMFVASDIPTSPGERHKYIVDWAGLSQGGEGVTIEVDLNGDGIFEYTFTSDSELTQSEFLAETTPPLSVSITPLSATILLGQSLTFTSTVSGGTPPYSYQWCLNDNPVSGATSSTWTFTPTVSGIYYIHLEVTDATDNTALCDTKARTTVKTSVPVGGYSFPIQVQTKTDPTIPYIALIAALTAIFVKLKPKTKRKH
jgi:hypothetical protein